MLAPQAVAPERVRGLRRVEYDQLVDSGLLDDARVELLLGALVEMSPQGPLHADVVRRLAASLYDHLPRTLVVRSHSPLALSDDSEPEPDVAVVPAGNYSAAHPETAILVIEVADSSLRKDRGVKSGLYAMASIPEYWLVDLTARVVEVYREPRTDRYADVSRVGIDGVLNSSALPGLSIAVSDILPAQNS